MENSLFDLQSGKKAKIKGFEGGSEFREKIASLNIRVGKTVKKITMQPLFGPVVMEIDNTKISIGRKMAMKILVEEE